MTSLYIENTLFQHFWWHQVAGMLGVYCLYGTYKILSFSTRFLKFWVVSTDVCLGAVHKSRPHKIAKNWPPLSAKSPHWFNQNSEVFLGQIVLKSTSEGASPPPVRKMSTLNKPLWLRTSFMGSSLSDFQNLKCWGNCLPLIIILVVF